MSNFCVSNDMLHTINWYGTLLSNECHRNHEVTRVEHSNEHDFYVVHDKRRSIFARASSASIRTSHDDTEGSARGRINGHMNESKKSQNKSYFYNYYPDENHTQANKSLKRGNFQDLSFASYQRFKEIKKSKIQDLFYCSKNMIDYLKIRNLVGCSSLFDKNIY